MQPLLNIAVNAARAAGDVIARYANQLEKINITAKGKSDYVSEVDIKAEQIIIHAIHKAYPEHGIIAEESGSYREDAENVWIIDPLDGTNNYLHGFPFYAVSIALRVQQRIEHAVVYDPLHHECFAASHGRGARLNDRRIRVSKQNQLINSMIGACLSTKQHPEIAAHYAPKYESLSTKCQSVRRTGSVALDLAYVASGRLDGFWAVGLPIWDIAAGVLLVQEAGGFVNDFYGHSANLYQGEILASTPKIFKELTLCLQ